MITPILAEKEPILPGSTLLYWVESGRGNQCSPRTMKTKVVSSVLACVWCLVVQGQEAERVVERGAHHASVERYSAYVGEDGLQKVATNSYVGLEDGLNYWDTAAKAWVEASEDIVFVPGGALAQHLQHKTFISSDANDPDGALDMEILGQTRLRSSLLALRYFDAASGKDALIGVVKHSRGALLVPNQVIYKDVLDGMRADLVYTLRRRGVEADLVLRLSLIHI